MKSTIRYNDPRVSREVTPREEQVIAMIMTAASNRDIALEFNISEETVKRHLSNIYDKVGVFTRLELVTKLNGVFVNKEIEAGIAKHEVELKKTIEALQVENAKLVSQLTMLHRELMHVRGRVAFKAAKVAKGRAFMPPVQANRMDAANAY